MSEPLRFYVIESKKYGITTSYKMYRFVSLYNGARGPWQYSREGAVEDGEAHKEIIEFMMYAK